MKTILKSLLVAVCIMATSTVFAQKSQDVKYQGEVNVSYGFSVVEDFRGIINVETIHGIRVNPNISVGLGIGANIFNDDYNPRYGEESDKLVLMPIFVDLKWYVLNGNISPYLAIDMGYNFGISKDHGYMQGLYLAPGIGVSFKMKEKGAFNLGLALKNNGVFAKQGSNLSIMSLAIKAAIVF